MTGRISRRQYVSAFGALVGGFSGCLSSGSTTSPNSTDQTSLFAGTSFDGASLVVRLEDDHDADTVTLVGPDGSAVGSSELDPGVTAVKFQLIDLRFGDHYTPGEHTLIASRDGEKIGSITLDLTPKLVVTSAEQYTGGRDIPSNRGNIVVTIENTGTAPTWVYYLRYEGALYDAANQEPSKEFLQTDPDLGFDSPESERETIIAPGESQELLGKHAPFRDADSSDCEGKTVASTIHVYSGVGEDVRQPVRVTLSGEELRSTLQQSCSELSIEMSGEGDGSN